MEAHRTTRRAAIALAALFPALAAACARERFDPALATRAYPADLPRARSVDIQVFREGPRIEIVNTTARSYREFDLWINQRYMRAVEALPAGDRLTLSLWEFYDERGDHFSAGGFWRSRDPMPVRLVEIEVPGSGEPLVGLVTIREEQE